MSRTSIGQRLQAAMKQAGLSKPADLARASGSTTPTISNWLNDNVDPEHVKAEQLFRIARAVGLSGHELLTGDPENWASAGVPGDSSEASQSVQPEQWKVAFQLVAEALGDDLSLPPAKHAEVVLLTYELLTDGMPRAKVLRFVRTAAA